jgi:hypothetical protein
LLFELNREGKEKGFKEASEDDQYFSKLTTPLYDAVVDTTEEVKEEKSDIGSGEKGKVERDGVGRKKTDAEIFTAAFRIDNFRALLNGLEKHDISLSEKEIGDKNHRACMAYFGLSEKEDGAMLKFFGLPYNVDKDLNVKSDTVDGEELSAEKRAERMERDESSSLVNLYDRLRRHDANLSEKEIAIKNHRTLLKYFRLSEKEDGAMLRLFGLPYDIGEEPGSTDEAGDGKDEKSTSNEVAVAEGEEHTFLTLFRRIEKDDLNLSGKQIRERNHRLIMTYFGLSEKEDGPTLKLFGLPYDVDKVIRTDLASTEIIRKYNEEVENSAIEKRPSLSALYDLLDKNHPDSSENEIADKNHRMMMTYFGLNEEDHGYIMRLFGLKFSTPDEKSEKEKNSVNNESERKSSSTFSSTDDSSLTESARRLAVLDRRKAELVWEANKYKAQKSFQYVAKSVSNTLKEFVPNKTDVSNGLSKEKNQNNIEGDRKTEGSDKKEDKP